MERYENLCELLLAVLQCFTLRYFPDGPSVAEGRLNNTWDFVGAAYTAQSSALFAGAAVESTIQYFLVQTMGGTGHAFSLSLSLALHPFLNRLIHLGNQFFHIENTYIL